MRQDCAILPFLFLIYFLHVPTVISDGKLGDLSDNIYLFTEFLLCIKDVLHKYLCIAFMFNGGQLHALTIHPIDTRVCMVYLYYQG